MSVENTEERPDRCVEPDSNIGTLGSCGRYYRETITLGKANLLNICIFIHDILNYINENWITLTKIGFLHIKVTFDYQMWSAIAASILLCNTSIAPFERFASLR